MIPLVADSPRKKVPWMTLWIVSVNIGVFLYQTLISPRGLQFHVEAYGLVPSHLFSEPADLISSAPRFFEFLKFFSAMFMHGGFFHLAQNMLFLIVFGRGLEAALGGRSFLVLYLISGILASIAHVYFFPQSTAPLVGASGAISGVLGAYLMLFPHFRVLTLIPIFFYVTTIRIPAAFFLGLWFLMQVLNSRMGGMVAWYAHIGGFLAGFVLVRFFILLRPKRKI